MSPSAVVIVPSTPLLDAPELEAVLRSALRCEPSALQSLSQGGETSGSAAEGYQSKCGSMTVDAVVRDRAHKLHLFVKRADGKDIVEGLDSFCREALFYQTVLPRLEKAWRRRGHSEQEEPRTLDLGPAAYLGTNDVVVMEDLTRLGYKAVENWLAAGPDFSSVQQALRALARLHAATLLAVRRDGVDLVAAAPDLLLEHFMTRKPGTVGRRLFDCAADVTCDVLLPRLQSRLQVPQTKHELQRLRDLTRDIYLKLDVNRLRAKDVGGLMVLSHGDVWPNNVLFKFDEQGLAEHAVLVDYQMARLAPPALDVVMYLHTGTRKAFRDQHKDALLRGYHEDLTRFAKERGLDISKDFGWETFLASAEQVRPLACALGLSYHQLIAGAMVGGFYEDSGERAQLLLESEFRGAQVARWCDAEARYLQIMLEDVQELLGLAAKEPAAAAAASA